ncbi:hypothetical protein KFK09_005702 [Dendrobium nobile]|uniref:Uncharacterized protein n=1 Tax=Dendrobium nobile TaxID=94219 RepID=A0A8T3BWJ5_DENNO|nr:hypothetical protein KFK09_005702 [Dendrobium nobile]
MLLDILGSRKMILFNCFLQNVEPIGRQDLIWNNHLRMKKVVRRKVFFSWCIEVGDGDIFSNGVREVWWNNLEGASQSCREEEGVGPSCVVEIRVESLEDKSELEDGTLHMWKWLFFPCGFCVELYPRIGHEGGFSTKGFFDGQKVES